MHIQGCKKFVIIMINFVSQIFTENNMNSITIDIIDENSV